MNRQLRKFDLLIISTICLLVIITITGLFSFQTDNSYLVTNQYGHEVMIFGSGIYAHDSYLRAPIFIGTDFTMLILVVPLLIIALIKDIKNRTIKSKLFLTAVLSVVLYYAACICFGVTYNAYLLIYIALFASSLFGLIISLKSMDTNALQKSKSWNFPSRGVFIFLVATCIALLAAWLPDIFGALFAGTTLPLIEVYTTEITYVLDLGITCPLILICLYLLKKKNGLGVATLAIILMICMVIGAMLPIQTLAQILAGIEIPIPVLVTKVAVFVVLAVFAIFFNLKLYKNIKA